MDSHAVQSVRLLQSGVTSTFYKMSKRWQSTAKHCIKQAELQAQGPCPVAPDVVPPGNVGILGAQNMLLHSVRYTKWPGNLCALSHLDVQKIVNGCWSWVPASLDLMRLLLRPPTAGEPEMHHSSLSFINGAD